MFACTVEAPVSGHPWEAEEVSTTGADRNFEYEHRGLSPISEVGFRHQLVLVPPISRKNKFRFRQILVELPEKFPIIIVKSEMARTLRK